MADKTIRISEENWRRLEELKEDGDSFDDVVTRLTTGDRWSGFGALAETGVAEGMEDAHARLNDELRRRVDESN
jgi:predicted CopG family antitoxin